jgi:hypothetical protein
MMLIDVRCPDRVSEPKVSVEIGLVPVTLAEANVFVKQHHRHSKPVVGAKFAVGVADANGIVGVGIAGRPVARALDDGWTIEFTRVCTDGTPNACSMLYGALWRAAKALGYRRAVTYTKQRESGASLRASGWTVVAELPAHKGWNRPSRPRVDNPREPQLRWELTR